MKKDVKKKDINKQSSKTFELDAKKTKYFVAAIVLLILLSVLLIVHFNNKSLVSGDEDVNTTTKTTTTVTTTKKKTVKKQQAKKEEVKEEVKEEAPVYKSTIDDANKLVYNYQLTDEINDTDILKSSVLEVDESLKAKNVILLYDISLYDSNLVKKSVKNSRIDISIPLSKDLLTYEDLKVIYIDDNGVISDEKFDSLVEDGYIKFSTTHLSKFGITGIKKEVIDTPVIEEDETPNNDEIIDTPVVEEAIDLSKVNVEVKVNGEVNNDYSNLFVTREDKIDVVVKGLEEIDKDYKVYYLLRDKENKNEYIEYTADMLKNEDVSGKYTLIIKVVVDEIEKSFEIGTLNLYDIVFEYDKNEEVKENKVYGELKNEDGSEYLYDDIDINKDIVIDYKEETIEDEIVVPDEETKEEIVLPDEETGNEDTTQKEESVNEETTPSEDETESVLPPVDGNVPEGEENLTDKATISLKGNIYLVEKTDITDLEITGHLIIDTNEDIVYSDEQLANVYSIIIRSEEFTLNGKKYTYKYTKDGIVISRLDETDEEIGDIFNGYEYDNTKEELIFTKKEVTASDEKEEIGEEVVEQPSIDEQIPQEGTNPEVTE